LISILWGFGAALMMLILPVYETSAEIGRILNKICTKVFGLQVNADCESEETPPEALDEEEQAKERARRRRRRQARRRQKYELEEDSNNNYNEPSVSALQLREENILTMATLIRERKKLFDEGITREEVDLYLPVD
jgi:hypothetical protein